MDEPKNLFRVCAHCSPARRGCLLGEFDDPPRGRDESSPLLCILLSVVAKVSKPFPYSSRCSEVIPSPTDVRAAAVLAGPPVLILPAPATTKSMPKGFNSAR